MPLRRVSVALLVLLAALAIAGCGGSGDEGTTRVLANGETVETTPPDATFPEPTVPEGSPQPPPGASETVREIYRQFTLRKPDPRVKGSAAAIAAGRAACAGKTSVEVERRYFPIAVEMGSLDPESGQAKMISEVARYAKNVAEDPSFVAGQLAAGAYQATLPPRVATYGYAGCAYELARQVERELTAGK